MDYLDRRGLHRLSRAMPLLLLITLLSGCFGSSGSPGSVDIVSIQTLSSRADMVTGNDALVEVVLEDGVDPANVTVEIEGGADVTEAFALRSDGRFVGLVEAFEQGQNTLRAYTVAPATGKRLAVTAHPPAGPVFSGPHMDPWICATPDGAEVEVTDPVTGNQATVATRVSGLDEAPDEHCEAPAIIDYYYQPADADPDCDFTITGGNACFEPFDPDSPPADEDIATFTNDRGDSVRSIIAVETGTLNRGMYSLVVFHDPDEPHHPAEPQRGWNNKLIMTFGFAAGNSRFQELPVDPLNPGGVFFNETALRKGYMLGLASLANNLHNTNYSLAAESLMMFREHITTTRGEIRFTVGSGASGSAIQQISISSAYPGLIDGILPGAVFPDTTTTSIEVASCGLANEYLQLDGVDLTEEQQNAITGHDGVAQCAQWVQLFLPTGDPANPQNCSTTVAGMAIGDSFPPELTYDPDTNPQGVRCNYPEHNRNMMGTIINSFGTEFAPFPLDNTGVQVGLQALQNGLIDAEEFVDLNERIGYYDQDQQRVEGPGRLSTEADLASIYRSGMIADGANLDRLPIIEIRHDAAGEDFHANWRSMQLRQRLINANGHHDNHVILGFDGDIFSVLALPDLAFGLMDEWLEAVEADASHLSRAQKVIANKPLGLGDACFVEGEDVGLESEDCPINFEQSPLQVAGGPVSEDILKCQLKPLDFSDPDYTDHSISFDQDQQNRLQTVFATGVCDWSLPGVGQQPSLTWPDFSDGPGGEPAGPAPTSF